MRGAPARLVLFALAVACGTPSARPDPDHPPPPEAVDLPELDLAEAVLDRLEIDGWDGSLDRELPPGAARLDARDVARWVDLSARHEAEARIPAEVADLYLAPGAADARRVLSEARSSFVAFLADNGVAEAYLSAFDQVIPDTPDRLVYRADADLARSSVLVPLQTPDGPDFGRMVLEITAVDAWSAARLAAEAGLAGPAPPLQGPERDAWLAAVRDWGVRFTTWHELSHALQRAYLHPHLPAAERISRAAWTLASHRLLDVDPALGFTWGNRTGAAFRLRRAIDERQADGLAFQVLARDLTADQAKRAWDVWFSRLDAPRAQLDRIRDQLASLSPDASPEDLAEPIGHLLSSWPDADQRAVLVALAHRLAGIPEVGGHLSPLPPDQSAPVWRALRQTPDVDPEAAGRRRQDR